MIRRPLLAAVLLLTAPLRAQETAPLRAEPGPQPSFGAEVLSDAPAPPPPPPVVETLPASVAAMIEAVAGDEQQLKIVANAARKTNPAHVTEIDAKVAAITQTYAEEAAVKAEETKTRLATQRPLEGWSGSGEVGAFSSSGNTNNSGVAIAARATKSGLKWRHTARATIDYQRENGLTSKERYVVGYEGNRTISDDAYALISGGYESDRFSGFNHRFSQSIGIGYKLVDETAVRIALEGGPALRQTLFTNGVDNVAFAARAATDMRWAATPRWTLTSNSAVFFDNFNISFQSLTSATGKLNGALSARASFQYNSESNPPDGRKTTDTTSRMTLVYSF